MTLQRNGKAGSSRRIGEKRLRILHPRPPARGGGAGRRPGLGLRSNQRFDVLACANTQQKNRHAGSFRRARQTQGRSEIEGAWRAENFDHRRAKTFATCGFNARAQNGLGIPAAHQRQRGGLDAKFGQPHAVQSSGLALQNILPHPE